MLLQLTRVNTLIGKIHITVKVNTQRIENLNEDHFTGSKILENYLYLIDLSFFDVE